MRTPSSALPAAPHGLVDGGGSPGWPPGATRAGFFADGALVADLFAATRLAAGFFAAAFLAAGFLALGADFFTAVFRFAGLRVAIDLSLNVRSISSSACFAG
jgi:hypothetical protein